MGHFNISTILIILIFILILFGGKKIPELMKGLGSGMKEFKKAIEETADTDNDKENNKKSFEK